MQGILLIKPLLRPFILPPILVIRGRDQISDSPVLITDIISDSISRSDAALVRKSPIMLRCMNPIPPKPILGISG